MESSLLENALSKNKKQKILFYSPQPQPQRLLFYKIKIKKKKQIRKFHLTFSNNVVIIIHLHLYVSFHILTHHYIFIFGFFVFYLLPRDCINIKYVFQKYPIMFPAGTTRSLGKKYMLKKVKPGHTLRPSFHAP